MSGVQNTVQKFVNASKGEGFNTHEQRNRNAKKSAAHTAKMAQYTDAVMPDEEAVRMTERRKAARRRSARAKTIMTDRETLG